MSSLAASPLLLIRVLGMIGDFRTRVYCPWATHVVVNSEGSQGVFGISVRNGQFVEVGSPICKVTWAARISVCLFNVLQ